MYLDDTSNTVARGNLCDNKGVNQYDLRQADLLAARRGSMAALGVALESCRGLLLYVAKRDLNGQLSSKVDAADLVQQTFLEALRDFGKFRGDNLGQLEGWLIHLLRNNVRDCVARHRARRQITLDREIALDHVTLELVADRSRRTAPTVAAFCESRELDEQLAQAIASLPPSHRRVIVWRHSEGLCFGEIGQRMGLTQNAARKLWTRAIGQLRAQLS